MSDLAPKIFFINDKSLSQLFLLKKGKYFFVNVLFYVNHISKSYGENVAPNLHKANISHTHLSVISGLLYLRRIHYIQWLKYEHLITFRHVVLRESSIRMLYAVKWAGLKGGQVDYSYTSEAISVHHLKPELYLLK